MTQKSLIPTEDEFERASQIMRKQAAGTSETAEDGMAWLQAHGATGRIHVIPETPPKFRAYTFFETEAVMEAFLTSHRQAYEREIARALNGRRSDEQRPSITFEYDSDEVVQRNWDGDYYARMS